MQQDYPSPTMPGKPSQTGRGRLPGRLRRLVLKELREILRDRRTIITLVVMPLLIYPLLALVFQRFLLTSLSVHENLNCVIGVESSGIARLLASQLHEGQMILQQRAEQKKKDERQPPTANQQQEASGHWTTDDDGVAGALSPELTWVELRADEAEQHIVNSSLHLAVLARRDLEGQDGGGLESPLTWELVYRMGLPASETALNFVESRLRAFNELQLDARLKQLGVSAALPAPTTRRAVDFAGAPVFSLAALIPLILVLMTVTGAVYPAIDLTAGERERGTLEMLIAAPVPRLGLLMAKYVAVLTVALLTAIVNLIGMTTTAQSTGLAATLFGEQGMSFVVVLKVLLLLGLFAAFFSAILLALTSYARSFKEAQAYIIPLMLLCLVPGVVCLVPSLEFSGWLAVTPLVNIVLLARDTLEGDVQPVLAAAAVVSTALYIAAAIALAARIFGTDAILYGSPSTWSDVFRRPLELQPAGTLASAMLVLAMMFPTYFVLASVLAGSPYIPLARRLMVSALMTAMVFGVLPALVATFNRVRVSEGFALRIPNMLAWMAAGLLGLVLWPLAHEVFLLNRWLGITDLGGVQLASVKGLVSQLRTLPYGLVVMTLAIVPGVFEELFFRGFFFTSLRNVFSPWRTIVLSAVLFGLFHVVAGSVLVPERFLPSTFLGLVLGWVRYRTGSVLPCMVLHALHNGLLLSITYWEDELLARGFGVENEQHWPILWLAAAVAGVVAAGTLLNWATRRVVQLPAALKAGQ